VIYPLEVESDCFYFKRIFVIFCNRCSLSAKAIVIENRWIIFKKDIMLSTVQEVK